MVSCENITDIVRGKLDMLTGLLSSAEFHKVTSKNQAILVDFTIFVFFNSKFQYCELNMPFLYYFDVN